jgi:hypothetical protein
MRLRDIGKRGASGLLVVFGLFAAFWVWYCIAANYDYSALAGTYVFHGEGVTSTLQLRKDATFHQTVHQNGQTQQAEEHWQRIGEGGVVFSPQFLRVPGARTFIEHGDGSIAEVEFYGHFQKFLGVYPSLYLDGEPRGPAFHKQLFR